MGVYYDFTIVHDRVLIWWTDHSGVTHSKWIEGEDADRFIVRLNKREMETQQDLAFLSKFKD